MKEPLNEKPSRAFVKSFIPAEKETERQKERERSSSGLTARVNQQPLHFPILSNTEQNVASSPQPIMLSQPLHK